MNLKQFLLWLPMIVIAIANAGLREMVWDNYFDELTAHQISTATLILFCTVYIGLIFPFIGVRSFNHVLLIGFLWVLLTVGFEFVFGFLVMSNSLKELINDYNLLQGRLWSVFLMGLFILPSLFYTLRG